ncbi:MAG: hypothetical protein GXP29_06390 [Planctomycetes bacterium]|nr:hypothetical protein [Planctomycetota bacterium]
MSTATFPQLNEYRPSEHRAILVHKYYLGIERGCDPTFEQAVESWEAHHATGWRGSKMRRDVEAQFKEIEKHRERMSSNNGESPSWEHAAREWIETQEASWRVQWESSTRAGA